MADRVNADGLPKPSHMASDVYLLRQCQLLDQISRQLDELLAQGQAPVIAFTSAPEAQVELVTEPAEPKPPVAKKAAPKAAKKAAPKNA